MITPARLLAYIAVIYFGAHVITGSLECTYNFCPGDSESDWVYEYTDDSGKRYIVIDGKPVSKDTYDRNLGIGAYLKEEEK
jgi:hypothetical protein